MLVIQLNVFLVGALILASALLGYAYRSAQIKGWKRKVDDLEREMLSNHAEILQLQKEKVMLEQQLKETSVIPVIPISSKSEDKKVEKIQDNTLRKKLASQTAANKHS